MAVCPKCFEKNPQLGAKCPRDGFYFIHDDALEDAEYDPKIGTLAAEKFVILSLISEGGMGAVYRALQLPVEREVAFKVLRAELEDSTKGRERFVQEARAVSKLSHPNIITLHDFGFEANSHPYMVMEYAPGVSLTKWMRADDITVERVVHVIKQVLSALSDAHNQGIVHRDLKPDNMIVTRTGNDPDFVKLLDFGIARLINEDATRGLTREGEVFGTPHYMAPEQAQGKKNVGPPADVYAVGIMMYELLCGEAPFDAPTPLSVLFMHINEEFPEFKPRPGIVIPEPIKALVRRATSKAPEDRYANARQMLEALSSQSGRRRDSDFAAVSGSFTAPDFDDKGGRQTEVTPQMAYGAPEETATVGSGPAQPTGPVRVYDPNADLATSESLRSPSHRNLIIVAVLGIIAVLATGVIVVTLGSKFSGDADQREAAAQVEQAPLETPPPAAAAVISATDEQGGDDEEVVGDEEEVGDEEVGGEEEASEGEAAEEVAVEDSKADSKVRTKLERKSPKRFTAPKKTTAKRSVEPKAEVSAETTPRPAEGPAKFSRPVPKSEDAEPKKFQAPTKFERAQ